MEGALPFMGKRANLPVASLPLLAALTPGEHTITLMDENVEAINFERCAKADIVGVTGMSVQRFRMKEILAELKRRGCFTVVGGPLVTVQEDYFEGLADVIFIGEAEETWPQFLGRVETSAPSVPLRADRKVGHEPRCRPLGSTCSRCGITPSAASSSRGVVRFSASSATSSSPSAASPGSRRPPQVIAEIEALWAQGMRIVFIVDDNLIGNKKAIKDVLQADRRLAGARAQAIPITFFTEASIDLADDAELMRTDGRRQLHRGRSSGSRARTRSRSARPRSSRTSAQGGTMLEKVHRIQDAGIEVWCGMIIGFDNDDETIFEMLRSQVHRRGRIPSR